MGDISIIARRLPDGQVQYGWSGNGGYYCMVGARLLEWYQNPKDVEYLFGLGQTQLIGRVGSENGGFNWFESHAPIGRAFWVDTTERMIFSKIAFVDYGYFYDLDHKWYYVVPGPFRIKIPLELINNNVDDRCYEFDYLKKLNGDVASFIFKEYRESNLDFKTFMNENDYDSEIILDAISEDGIPSLYSLYDKYRKIYEYFDNWILVRTNDDYTDITEIVMQKKEDVHVETCMW
ncbi:hypothetical protein [Sporofaciens sp. SGI.106]|uniref:hypothetical protein n=1 Tax=Sporofaciens sp. SGI.106 TaxID=3420568 RepID=UPI002A93BE33|nr:hypothetical protein [Lachnoclostridium sp.]